MEKIKSAKMEFLTLFRREQKLSGRKQPDRRAGLKPATEPFIGTNAAGVKAEAVARAATQRMATFIIFCEKKDIDQFQGRKRSYQCE
jgi:hypothetical protein